MEFKIDTKDAYSVIQPQEIVFSAITADKLAEIVQKTRQSGSANIILDMGNVQALADAAILKLINLHEESYESEQSFVITGTNTEVLGVFKKNESDLILNVDPKMIEAIDIVSMEILERDLLGEE
jgi:anti-anti-sigma regulatory factor